MLNADFTWLDPELEHLDRLAKLAPPARGGATTWRAAWQARTDEERDEAARHVAANLARPGVRTPGEVAAAQRRAAAAQGRPLPPRAFFGWPEDLLSAVLAERAEPCTWLFAVLDAREILAGCLAGASRGALDWLATFQYLWADDPELAARQALADLPVQCTAAEKRFGRPVEGLFVYLDEFIAWRDRNFTRDVLEAFFARGTARRCTTP